MYSDAVEKPLSLRIALGHGDPRPLHWTGSIHVDNGRLVEVKGMGFVQGDKLQEPPNHWSFQGANSGKGLLLDICSLRGTLCLECSIARW